MLVQMNNAVAVGPTINDIVQTGTFTFKLRAERDERGSGRIYTLTYRATDACGNTTTRSATVRVPINDSSA
jgi:endo-1,4-beta-xylanase